MFMKSKSLRVKVRSLFGKQRNIDLRFYPPSPLSCFRFTYSILYDKYSSFGCVKARIMQERNKAQYDRNIGMIAANRLAFFLPKHRPLFCVMKFALVKLFLIIICFPLSHINQYLQTLLKMLGGTTGIEASHCLKNKYYVANLKDILAIFFLSKVIKSYSLDHKDL